MSTKVEKYVEFAQTKVKTMIKEKRFFSNEYRLKYMLEKNNSDTLIVIFSGFTRIGLKARYNYNRTLRNINANKLFILDDFGYDERGAYYLGKDMDFKIEIAVSNLINKIKNDLGTNKTIYTGTSKGGYAALYFGLPDKGSYIISGAPQYYLGFYLNGTENYRENCLKYIIGKDITEEKVKHLDDLLPNMIRNYTNNNIKLYLHYSDQENTYRKQIKYLIRDLSNNGIEFNSDIEGYKDHNDVGLYFPNYLVNTINQII